MSVGTGDVRRPLWLQTALAVEAFLDEIVFIVGPTLVTMLASGVSPALGVLSAAAFGLVGSLALALLRGSEPPSARAAVRRTARVPLGVGRFWPALVAYWWLGVLFGGAEIVVVALATAAGRQVLAGPLLAAWAAGRLVAAAIVGAVSPNGLRWRASGSASSRWRSRCCRSRSSTTSACWPSSSSSPAPPSRPPS